MPINVDSLLSGGTPKKPINVDEMLAKPQKKSFLSGLFPSPLQQASETEALAKRVSEPDFQVSNVLAEAGKSAGIKNEKVLDALRLGGMLNPASLFDIARHPIEAAKGLGGSTVDLARMMMAEALHKPPPLDIQEQLTVHPFTESFNLATPALLGAGGAHLIGKRGGLSTKAAPPVAETAPKPEIKLNDFADLAALKAKIVPVKPVPSAYDYYNEPRKPVEPPPPPPKFAEPIVPQEAPPAPADALPQALKLERRFLERRGATSDTPEGAALPPPPKKPAPPSTEELHKMAETNDAIFTKFQKGQEYTAPQGAKYTEPDIYEFRDKMTGSNVTTTNLANLGDDLFKTRKAYAEKGSTDLTTEEMTKVKDWVANAEKIRAETGKFSGPNKEQLSTELQKGLAAEPTAANVKTAEQIQGGERGIQVSPPEKPLLNLEHFNMSPETKTFAGNIIEQIRPEIEKIKGAPTTHAETADLAARAAVNAKVIPRETTQGLEAGLLALRQEFNRLATEGKPTPELVKMGESLTSQLAHYGRMLNSAAIEADVGGKPSMAGDLMRGMAEKLKAQGKSQQEVFDLIKNTDFGDQKQVLDLNRKVAPFMEKLGNDIDEYRYINVLSGPQTLFERNLGPNLFNILALEPAKMAAKAVIESRKLLTGKGKERKAFFSEVPAYLKGTAAGIKPGLRAVKEVYQGKRQLKKPDLEQRMAPHPLLKYPSRAVLGTLEAQDLLGLEMVKKGKQFSEEVKARAQGKPLTDTDVAKLTKDAQGLAEDLLYRGKLDPTNESHQGAMSATMDALNDALLSLVKRRYVGRPLKLIQMFINIPVRTTKMGMQFTPGIGAIDYLHGTNKLDITARQAIGSTVATWAALKAANGQLNFKAPADPKEKELFYASGKKPYSMEIQGHTVPLQYLGPLAFPMVLVGATDYEFRRNPDRLNSSTIDKVRKIMGDYFFYVGQQGMLYNIPQLISDGINSSLVASVGKQFIPASGTQRWAAQMIDTVQRKTSKTFDIEGIWQNIKRDLPFLSKSVEPFTLPYSDVPETHPLPLAPYPIDKLNPKYLKPLDFRHKQLEFNALRKKELNKLGVQP